MAGQGENDGIADGRIGVPPESHRRPDRFWPSEMPKRDENCSQDFGVRFAAEHFEEDLHAVVRKCAIRNPELPENVSA